MGRQLRSLDVAPRGSSQSNDRPQQESTRIQPGGATTRQKEEKMQKPPQIIVIPQSMLAGQQKSLLRLAPMPRNTSPLLSSTAASPMHSPASSPNTPLSTVLSPPETAAGTRQEHDATGQQEFGPRVVVERLDSLGQSSGLDSGVCGAVSR